jgi:uncharacterized membrane-anchored protein YhcB (DUF1043 family)
MTIFSSRWWIVGMVGIIVGLLLFRLWSRQQPQKSQKL